MIACITIPGIELKDTFDLSRETLPANNNSFGLCDLLLNLVSYWPNSRAMLNRMLFFLSCLLIVAKISEKKIKKTKEMVIFT